MTEKYLSTSSSLIEKTALIVLCGGAFLLPFFFLPITDGFVGISKIFLGYLLTIICVFLFGLKTLQKQRLEIILSPLTLPFALVFVSAFLSTFFTHRYPVEALLGWGGVWLSCGLIGLLVPSLVSPQDAKHIPQFFSYGTAILVVLSVLQALGVGISHPLSTFLGAAVPHTLAFNPAGSALIAIQVVIAALVYQASTAFYTKRVTALESTLLAILGIGVVLYGWALMPGKETSAVFIPFGAQWSLVLDTFRTPLSALIGFGPEAFPNVYSQLRPLWLNGTPLWSLIFSQGINTPLTLVVTFGLVGLVSWTFMAFKIVRYFLASRQQLPGFAWLAVSFLIMMVVLPPNGIVTLLQFLCFVAWIAANRVEFPELHIQGLTAHVIGTHSHEPKTHHSTKIVIYALGAAFLLLSAGSVYGLGRTYLAMIRTQQSLRAQRNNDAVQSYELQQAAVRLNPYIDTSRRRYALLNLTIATSLASKTDLSEQEKKVVVDLVQQAIREGRAAATLDPYETQNWQTLATVYENLIGSAEGSDQWSVTTYTQAIQTSPNDPILRNRLGNLLFRLGQYNEALSIYQQALKLQPDLAITYYNIGNTFKQLGNKEMTVKAYQEALKRVPANSEDYTRISQQLEEAQKMPDKPTTTPQTGTATRPQATPSPTPTPISTQSAIPPITSQNLTEPANEVISPESSQLEVSPEDQSLLNSSDLLGN